MTLYKDMLTKATKKGRMTAADLLNRLATIGGMPEPHYQYTAGGSVKKPSHFFKVMFRVPKFLMKQMEMPTTTSTIVGGGRDRSKKFAKSLAALEVVHRLEEHLDQKRGGLAKQLEDYVHLQKQKQEKIEATPISKEIAGVSWSNLPIDSNFPQTCPADRRGRIDFSPKLLKDPMALLGARAITLTSDSTLPTVAIHANQTDEGILQCWANIRANGKIAGVTGQLGDISMGAENEEAELYALSHIGNSLSKRRDLDVVELVQALEARPDSSFGMAKLNVDLPKHHFKELEKLLEELEDMDDINGVRPEERRQNNSQWRKRAKTRAHDDKDILKARIATFRAHQKELPLPVDSVETQIQHDAPVTIVRGGTGSGKTTRYPLMLSLFSPSVDAGKKVIPTKILVAQPRRLACQTAARRVAYEQGYEIGEDGSPIGYAIRFESFPSSADSRTVDFVTPGVLLRRATNDPLLSDVTHLCIDEVHERNADVDLLLALVKQAQKRREQHKTLPPLRLVLMSATLDSSQWESYFGEDDNTSIKVVDVPDVRRFPIDMIHLGDKAFPSHLKGAGQLIEERKRPGDEYDNVLCQATAELAVELFRSKDMKNGGSILCFLPGMEEIRLADQIIQSMSRGRPTVRYLHSSLSSEEQAKAFIPGSKIILSTNIAETSVTIPDVKFVIDSGRERQFSLLDASSQSDFTTAVVGSQLVTVNISQASAEQRAGRAGRVSAGTCYRLYTREDLKSKFIEYTVPEMQRIELSQLVLHSISLYHPASGHSSPLTLLLGAPDPPAQLHLRQTLYGLFQQGLVDLENLDENLVETLVRLTPLGEAVSALPASPRIGRMLFLGLVLRAIDPALTIAALLSVPKTFSNLQWPREARERHRSRKLCSDIIVQLQAYQEYLEDKGKKTHPWRPIFEQVTRVRRQLEQSIRDHLKPTKIDWEAWNANSRRVAAQAGLVCGATPHIAHLVNGRSNFATRDVNGYAKIHPSSVNVSSKARAHWYVYHQCRTTKAPYLHVTTAASPLELALFSDSSSWMDDDSEPHWEDGSNEWLFIADQWVPVDVSNSSQRTAFARLKRMLMYDMLQRVALDPHSFVDNEKYGRVVLFALAAIEHQRLSR